MERKFNLKLERKEKGTHVCVCVYTRARVLSASKGIVKNIQIPNQPTNQPTNTLTQVCLQWKIEEYMWQKKILLMFCYINMWVCVCVCRESRQFFIYTYGDDSDCISRVIYAQFIFIFILSICVCLEKEKEKETRSRVVTFFIVSFTEYYTFIYATLLWR